MPIELYSENSHHECHLFRRPCCFGNVDRGRRCIDAATTTLMLPLARSLRPSCGVQRGAEAPVCTAASGVTSKRLLACRTSQHAHARDHTAVRGSEFERSGGATWTRSRAGKPKPRWYLQHAPVHSSCICSSDSRCQVFKCLRWLHRDPELGVDPHIWAGTLAAGEDLALGHVLRSSSSEQRSASAQLMWLQGEEPLIDPHATQRAGAVSVDLHTQADMHQAGYTA